MGSDTTVRTQRFYEFYSNGGAMRTDLSRLAQSAAVLGAFVDELGIRGFSRSEALSVVCSPIGQDVLRREFAAVPLSVSHDSI